MEEQREKIFETKDGSFISYITYEDCLKYQEYLNSLCVKENSENYAIDSNEEQKKKQEVELEIELCHIE